MNTQDYILKKFNLEYNETTPMPIEIPNVGRENLAKWLHELNFKSGVEVGVAEGYFSEIICQANPQMAVYGGDAWEPYDGYPDYQTQAILQSMHKKALDCLAKYPNYKIIKTWSIDAAKQFEDASLDFVYIDANHSKPYITQDIEEWSKKVRPGGIISGHDYVHWRKQDYKVIEAVREYIQKNNISPYFVLGLRQKLSGLIRDDSRSWMWVKP